MFFLKLFRIHIYFFFLFHAPIDKATDAALHKNRSGDVTFTVSVFHEFDFGVGVICMIDVKHVVGVMSDAPRLA